jgi:hypothetical protein
VLQYKSSHLNSKVGQSKNKGNKVIALLQCTHVYSLWLSLLNPPFTITSLTTTKEW